MHHNEELIIRIPELAHEINNKWKVYQQWRKANIGTEGIEMANKASKRLDVDARHN